MIPYIDIPPIRLVGPLAIQPFGLLVAIGLVVGYQVAMWETRRRGLDPKHTGSLVLWTLIGGFVVAHLVSVVFYFPEEIAANPLVLLKFWGSLSSYGGFAGGALAALYYIRREKLTLWPHVDMLALSLIAGWFFGRMGCSVVHDHPGKLSDFFLAVKYPGGARHDLGFYEWLFTILLIAGAFTLRRLDLRPGSVLVMIMIAYAPVRFGLDFLRTADRLYAGLTPGQYFSIALLIGGFVLWRRLPPRERA